MSDDCRTGMSRSTRRRLASVVLLWLVVIGAPRRAAAAPPEWSLRDYVHTTWTQYDGLPLGRLRRILQTSDGYLWLVTSEHRLLRFDGVRFVPVALPCAALAAVSAGNGDLWINCEDGPVLRRTAAGQHIELPAGSVPTQSRSRELFVDRRGQLWIYGSVMGEPGTGFIARLEPDGQVRTMFGHAAGQVVDATESPDGTIWFSDTKAMFRVRGDRVEVLPVPGARGLAADASGDVFGWDDETVWRLGEASASVFLRAPQGIKFASFPGGMAAADGGLWMGTRRHGMALIQDGRVETLPESRNGDFVSCVFIDREGTIWTGLSSGLHRFRKPRARLWSSLADRLVGLPLFLFIDSRANVWSSAGPGLLRTDPQGASRTIDGRYLAIGEDAQGRIWLARDSDIGFLRDGRFQPVRDDSGASVTSVYAFKPDNSGTLWALARDSGLYRVSPGPPHRVLDIPNAASRLLPSTRSGTWVTLRDGNVMQVTDDHGPVIHDTQRFAGGTRLLTITEVGDSIWLSGHNGLLRWRNGAWTTWGRAEGLPGTGGVYEVTTDRSGRFWLMTNGGIIVLPRAQLDGTPDGRPSALTFAQIGSLDRVFPHTGIPQTSPRVATDPAGRIYFATYDSIAVVDPASFSESALKPTVVLESVVADNQPVDLTTTPRLIEPSRLQFEYTSLSLRSPENIRFRYKLEGYDRDWIDSGGQRRVTYGTLKPGAYTFRVIGSGSEGVWNKEGASFPLQIAPLLWHRWWFWLSSAAVTALAIGGAYRRRVHAVTRQLQGRFEERLAERTRIARDLHDTLLQDALAAVLHVQLATDTLTQTGEPSPAISKSLPLLERAEQLLSRGVDQGRAAVTGLRSDRASQDLATTLEETVRQQRNYQDIDCRITTKGTPRPLQPGVLDDVSQIAREAVINACQHSRCRRIDVELVYTARHFRCVVRDDGQGMDTRVLQGGREGHWGLIGMRERAERIGGELDLKSSASAGTEVELRLNNQLAFGDAASRFRQWWATRFSSGTSAEQ
jgi:signal transduction histidine kinase/ligand-binding sensor domain-containing protein